MSVGEESTRTDQQRFLTKSIWTARMSRQRQTTWWVGLKMDFKKFWPDFLSVNTFPPKRQCELLDLSVLVILPKNPTPFLPFHQSSTSIISVSSCPIFKTRNVPLSVDQDKSICCGTGDHWRVVAVLKWLEAEMICPNPYPTFPPPHQYQPSRWVLARFSKEMS